MAPKLDKKTKMVIVGCAFAVIVIILCGALAFLYFDDQNKKNQQREELKQAFSDRLNETDRLYAQISGYPAASNKNFIDVYRQWVDGYRQLVSNYSQAAALLDADGATYKCMLANDSIDYANVTQACNAARDRARAANSTAAGYEREYQGRLGMKTNASAAFDQAVERSRDLYDKAWNLMQDNSVFWVYNGYLLYLKACSINNTLYNNSIDSVENAGAVYQMFLMGDEYYAVNTTIDSLRANSSKLGKRYVELQNTTVKVNLMNEELSQAYSSGKLRTFVSFFLQNENRIKGIEPMRIWNIVVHYKLIDKATGAVRSTCDVSVPEFSGPICDIYSGSMECDQYHEYRTEYTITFDY